jgi:hypothetical protein
MSQILTLPSSELSTETGCERRRLVKTGCRGDTMLGERQVEGVNKQAKTG